MRYRSMKKQKNGQEVGFNLLFFGCEVQGIYNTYTTFFFKALLLLIFIVPYHRLPLFPALTVLPSSHHHQRHHSLSFSFHPLHFPSCRSHRDSFKRLSFRRTQEESSWDAMTLLREIVLLRGWGDCHTAERRRGDERGENRKKPLVILLHSNAWEQYIVSTMEESRFFNIATLFINGWSVNVYDFMVVCYKRWSHTNKVSESRAKCSLLSISL